MSEGSTELIEIIRRIHGLLELLAEDKIAQRDAKQRATLREIVGANTAKQESIFLMDGTRTQKEILTETSVNQGNFSALVGKMHKAKLLVGDTKTPKLAITIPPNFFETNAETELRKAFGSAPRNSKLDSRHGAQSGEDST